jgi:esterase/lipase superfamily enzyme
MHLEDGMSVQRYGWGHSGMLTTPSNSGNYVAHADYEQLERTAKMLAEALHACHLQMLQSNNASEYAEEANQLAVAAKAAARKDGLL